MNVKIVKLIPEAKTPTYATDGSAAFDLYAATYQKGTFEDSVQVTAIFGTGLSFEVPVGHVMLIFSRSGHGFKNNVRLANCVGVIDSDYRGEVMVKLTYDSDKNTGLRLDSGDRIAQAMILPIERVSFTEVDSLSETERGTAGFGSSGS